MRAYVGVTDGDWYRHLLHRRASEVNFWQPSGARRFAAIDQGAPFLFKTHYRDRLANCIVGFGFFAGWVRLPVSRAWEFFGEDNGCRSLADMQERIRRYRGDIVPSDPEIGCIMLRDTTFLPPDQVREPPPDWSKNIVQGKTYDLSQGSYAEQLVRDLLLLHPDPESAAPDVTATTGAVPGDIFGDPRLRRVRVGQSAFKALVQEAYGRRCAITGDKIVPVLQAAHIRPVSHAGENRVDNGLLLRSDVHTLFDRGYLGVHPRRHTLLVSQRLRSEWGNGEEFYARAASGRAIQQPDREVDRPAEAFLEWHADTVFLAS